MFVQRSDEHRRAGVDGASILLVAVVFLVDISKRLMEVQEQPSVHPLLQGSVQVANLFLLTMSTVLILLEWWPRRYALPPDPGEEEAWIVSVQTQAAKERQFEKSITEQVVGSQENKKINSLKSRFLKWAFWVTAPVVLVDLGILVLLAINKLCPLLN